MEAKKANDYKFDISHLNLHYGDFHALKDVNMKIEANKITAFIGPSGCGKSTFLKTLNRMNDLVENCKIDGNVLLDGKDIFKEMDEITLRHRVGMVFQQPNPFPKSVYDNVAYGPRISGIKKKSQLDEIVERSLRQAAIWDELKDRLKKSALGLSGGQQQRLCIARALAVEPEVILMDEPTSALDPISASRIWRSSSKKTIRSLWSHIICSRQLVSRTEQHFSCWEKWLSMEQRINCFLYHRTNARKIISQEDLDRGKRRYAKSI